MSNKSRHEPPKSESSKERRRSFATMKDTRTTRNYPDVSAIKKSLVMCSYSEMGCDFYINKDNLERLIKHMKDQTEYHLQLTSEAYKKIKSENVELKKKYEKLKSEWNAYHMQADQVHQRRRTSSSDNKLSPVFDSKRDSLSPTPYSSERRLSGGRISPMGGQASETRRKSTEILSNMLNTEFVPNS